MIKVSEFLKKARERQHLSLEKLSSQTKIRQKYLKALEEGQWDRLPGLAYTRGFLKSYSEAVGLEKKQVLALFRREFKQETKPKLMPRGFFKPLGGPLDLVLTIKRIVSKMFLQP